jgi:hypothetical protein
MSRFAATQRLGVAAAPMSLMFTQELVNSRGPVSSRVDLLVDVEPAQNWLDGVLEDWQAEHAGLAAPRVQLTIGDLEDLRTVRASVLQLLARRDEGLFEGEAPPLNTPVNIRADPSGVQGCPVGAGVGWIASVLALELFRAEEKDLLRRLKICHNPLCTRVFYDRSKNNSRIWHDPATCGNQANVRAYRARQRGGVLFDAEMRRQ